MKLIISKGNSKIGKIANVSLRPVKDCINCKACKNDCYALKAYRMYPNVRKAWDNNSKLLRGNMPSFFAQLHTFLDTYKGKLFRYHVAGDIINLPHYQYIYSTAQDYPNIKFLVFTKSFDALLAMPSRTPKNLTVVLSLFPSMVTPKGLEKLPRAYAGNCKGKRFNNAMECIGNCEKCGLCWHLKEIKKDVRFNIH